MDRLAVCKFGVRPHVVLTFVRADSEFPPEGYEFVPDDSLDDGWSMEPPPPQPVPESVEARQLRKWLILHGHSIASIDAAIERMTDPVQRELTANEWEYSTSYTRRHPMFGAFVAATGLSEEQIDQAFREAAAL